MALIPISTAALSWAVKESGFSAEDLDSELEFATGTVESWIAGDSQPNNTQFRKLKSHLKRPASLFFMDTPPSSSTESTVTMRYAFGARSRSRVPEERVAIRDASRVRRFVSDLSLELGRVAREMPSASTNEDPESVATAFRSEYVDVPIEEQMSWSSPSKAFQRWRSIVEALDILVFLYPLGKEAARGFSFATDIPPLIGISTTWHPSVRIYSLFHELGHILTRTSSSCIEATTANPTRDPVERWCESFAAAFLMPRVTVKELADKSTHRDAVGTATWLSNKLCVSRKAALLRLVEIERARWKDFHELESRYEQKSEGGSSNLGRKRTRDVIRRHTYGGCLSIVDAAHRANLVNESDIRTFLRMHPDELT